MPQQPILERAFQLAASGDCANVNELRALLTAEGYHDAVGQTAFPSLRKQLAAAIAKRNAAPADAEQTPEAKKRVDGVLSLSYE